MEDKRFKRLDDIQKVDIERVFFENIGTLLSAIAMTGRSPFGFVIEWHGKLRILRDAEFMNKAEQDMFIAGAKIECSEILISFQEALPYGRKSVIKEIRRTMDERGLYAILYPMQSAVNAYLEEISRYWLFVKNKLLGGASFFILKNDFVDDVNEMPTDEWMVFYFNSLRSLNRTNIERFETRFSIIRGPQIISEYVFRYMRSIDFKLLLEQHEFFYDKMLEIDLSYPRRIGIVGASGTGKTLWLESLIEYYAKSHKVIHLNDFQGEMAYCKKPNKKRAIELSEFNKLPRGLDIEIFTLPIFNEEAPAKDRHRIDKIITLDPHSMKSIDWKTLLDLNMTQALVFDNVFKEVRGFSDINDLIDAVTASRMAAPTKLAIQTRLRHMMNQNIFKPDSTDIDDIIRSDKISVFDTMYINNDALKRGVFTFLSRKIMEYARKGINTKPFCIAADELGSLMPIQDKESSFERYLRELFTRMRNFNVSVLCAQQNVQDMPMAVRANLTDWFIFRIRDSSQLRLLKGTFGYDLGIYMEVVPILKEEHAVHLAPRSAYIGKMALPCCHHKYPHRPKVKIKGDRQVLEEDTEDEDEFDILDYAHGFPDSSDKNVSETN